MVQAINILILIQQSPTIFIIVALHSWKVMLLSFLSLLVCLTPLTLIISLISCRDKHFRLHLFRVCLLSHWPILPGDFWGIRLVLTGVPHGSVLGPLLYLLYTKSLGQVISAHGTKYHYYADATELFSHFLLPILYNHTATITQSCRISLQTIRRICPFLTDVAKQLLVQIL